ncbi:hypothetical protein B0H14DRAFT_3136566 [Mycena olivaceomarginata]|nr:hypothetical protein B0H14DRAFT_3136566 [Mycena olivaceomarginata]
MASVTIEILKTLNVEKCKCTLVVAVALMVGGGEEVILAHGAVSVYRLSAPFNPVLQLQPPFLLFWRMNMFPPRTRVFYWNGAGQTVYGTVKQMAHTGDGTMVVNIRNDNG